MQSAEDMIISQFHSLDRRYPKMLECRCGRCNSRSITLYSAFARDGVLRGAVYGDSFASAIALHHRTCSRCGQWCMHEEHPELAVPLPSKTCFTCRDCIHDEGAVQCLRINGQMPETHWIHRKCATCMRCGEDWQSRKHPQFVIHTIANRRDPFADRITELRCSACTKCNLCHTRRAWVNITLISDGFGKRPLIAHRLCQLSQCLQNPQGADDSPKPDSSSMTRHHWAADNERRIQSVLPPWHDVQEYYCRTE